MTVFQQIHHLSFHGYTIAEISFRTRVSIRTVKSILGWGKGIRVLTDKKQKMLF